VPAGRLKASRPSSLLFRCAVLAVAIISAAWAAYALPILSKQSPLQQMAPHIIDGRIFKPAVMTAMGEKVDAMMAAPLDRPAILGSAALFRLRVLELAIYDGPAENVDALMLSLDTTIRRSLANSPEDPFLWLVLFWLENTRNGFSKENLKYLRMSYVTGPNEGWVALRRNRFSLALFSQLPDDLARQAVAEFAGLVEAGFSYAAAEILISSGWKIRDKLVSALAGTDLSSRIDFAKAVYQLGYDINVPGVELPDQRPWR